jgi:hypothetical protein
MRIVIALLALIAAAPAFAETSAADLAKPPADAEHLIIMSAAGKHGDSWRWTTPDGAHWGRESLLFRGQTSETDSIVRFGPDSMPRTVAVRGVTPNGDAAEQFSIEGGKASWKSPVDNASAPYAATALYAAFGGPVELRAELIEMALKQPAKSLALLPAARRAWNL